MPEITLNDWKKWTGKGETLSIFVFEEQAPEAAKADGFKAKELETFLYRPEKALPAERVILIGLGKKSEFSLETLRRAATKVLRSAESVGLAKIAVRAPQIAKSPNALAEEYQALAEGLQLAAYRFDKHKTPGPDAPNPVQEIELWVPNPSKAIADAVKKGEIYSQATLLARDLINEPPSRMNPERLSKEAEKIGKAPISVKVFDTKEMEKMVMGGILGVGVGGAVPPRLVELIYKPSGKANKVVLHAAIHALSGGAVCRARLIAGGHRHLRRDLVLGQPADARVRHAGGPRREFLGRDAPGDGAECRAHGDRCGPRTRGHGGAGWYPGHPVVRSDGQGSVDLGLGGSSGGGHRDAGLLSLGPPRHQRRPGNGPARGMIRLVPPPPRSSIWARHSARKGNGARQLGDSDRAERSE